MPIAKAVPLSVGMYDLYLVSDKTFFFVFGYKAKYFSK